MGHLTTVLVMKNFYQSFPFVYRENDEEVGIGEVDDRVTIISIRSNIHTLIKLINPKQHKLFYSL